MTQPYMPGFEGEQRRADLSQWYTPPDVADRLASWVDESRVLEPAAGCGSLVAALARKQCPPSEVHAFDIDPGNARRTAELGLPCLASCRAADFLAAPIDHEVDVTMMNPPYENDLDAAFILRALEWAPRVVGIFRSAIVHGTGRGRVLWSRARIVRVAWMRSRPKFGGDFTPLTDFVAIEVRSGAAPAGEPFDLRAEWWP